MSEPNPWRVEVWRTCEKCGGTGLKPFESGQASLGTSDKAQYPKVPCDCAGGTTRGSVSLDELLRAFKKGGLEGLDVEPDGKAPRALS